MASPGKDKVAHGQAVARARAVAQSAACGGSVGQHVFVIGHWIHVVKRDVLRRFGVGWRATRGLDWRAAPQAEVAEDLRHDLAVINHGDDPHGLLAHRAAERIAVPDFEDEVAPFLGSLPAWSPFV